MDSSDAAEAPRFVDGYLAALLAQASHLISSEFHEVVRAHGLSVSEWRVLASLAGGEPMSIGRLAEVAVLKQPTVTRLLDRMEAKRQVERLGHDTDRRVTLVRITAAGSRTVARLIALAREHEARVFAPFGLRRAETLKATKPPHDRLPLQTLADELHGMCARCEPPRTTGAWP